MIAAGRVRECWVREDRDAEASARSSRKSGLDHRAPTVASGRARRARAVVPHPSHRDTSDREVAVVVNADGHRRVPLALHSRRTAVTVSELVPVAPRLSVTDSVTA